MGSKAVILRIYIGPVSKEFLNNIGMSTSRRQVQRSLSIYIFGCYVCTMLKQQSKNIQSPGRRNHVQRALAVAARLDVDICLMFE